MKCFTCNVPNLFISMTIYGICLTIINSIFFSTNIIINKIFFVLHNGKIPDAGEQFTFLEIKLLNQIYVT